MDIQTAKQIRIADFLYSLGHSPVKQQGINLWYKSPLREETEPSFKINTERNQWYDFAIGKGGNIIALAQELYYSDYVLTFPDFTRHFLLALSETVDSLLRAILIQ